MQNKKNIRNITKEILRDFIWNAELELSSTQKKLCFPIINRMYKKMSGGIKFAPIKIANNLISDGHHRYIASRLADYQIEKIPTVNTLATTAISWKAVVFDEEDWDTPAKIQILNEQDARYNSLPIDKIIELLNYNVTLS
jgi:acetoacetate decarboxylase